MAKKTAASPKVTAGSATVESTQAVTPAAVTPLQKTVGGAVGAEKAKRAAGAKREVSHEMIAERAYELYTNGTPGGPDDHWRQAEAELRG